jgi:hypothetical protein
MAAGEGVRGANPADVSAAASASFAALVEAAATPVVAVPGAHPVGRWPGPDGVRATVSRRPTAVAVQPQRPADAAMSATRLAGYAVRSPVILEPPQHPGPQRPVRAIVGNPALPAPMTSPTALQPGTIATHASAAPAGSSHARNHGLPPPPVGHVVALTAPAKLSGKTVGGEIPAAPPATAAAPVASGNTARPAMPASALPGPFRVAPRGFPAAAEPASDAAGTVPAPNRPSVTPAGSGVGNAPPIDARAVAGAPTLPSDPATLPARGAAILLAPLEGTVALGVDIRATSEPSAGMAGDPSPPAGASVALAGAGIRKETPADILAPVAFRSGSPDPRLPSALDVAGRQAVDVAGGPSAIIGAPSTPARPSVTLAGPAFRQSTPADVPAPAVGRSGSTEPYGLRVQSFPGRQPAPQGAPPPGAHSPFAAVPAVDLADSQTAPSWQSGMRPGAGVRQEASAAQPAPAMMATGWPALVDGDSSQAGMTTDRAAAAELPRDAAASTAGRSALAAPPIPPAAAVPSPPAAGDGAARSAAEGHAVAPSPGKIGGIPSAPPELPVTLPSEGPRQQAPTDQVPLVSARPIASAVGPSTTGRAVSDAPPTPPQPSAFAEAPAPAAAATTPPDATASRSLPAFAARSVQPLRARQNRDAQAPPVDAPMTAKAAAWPARPYATTAGSADPVVADTASSARPKPPAAAVAGSDAYASSDAADPPGQTEPQPVGPATVPALPNGAQQAAKLVAAGRDETQDAQVPPAAAAPFGEAMPAAPPAASATDQASPVVAASPAERLDGSAVADPRPGAHIVAAAMRLVAMGGGRSVTLSLSPEELGNVEIRVSRDGAGAAAVAVTVQRPETLALLRSDAPGLQAAFDRAGLTVAERHVTLHLAAATPGTPDGRLPQATPSLSSPGSSPGQDAASQGYRPHQQRQARASASAGFAVNASVALPAAGASARDGLDITA